MDVTLEWVKVSDWYMQTACGKFRCRKYYSGDVLDDPGPVRYQLYSASGIPWGPPQESFVNARRLAERYQA